MNIRSAFSSRLALQRFFARTDFVPSKTSISRRSRPGSAAPFKDSHPGTLAFMLSTLSASQAAKRVAGCEDAAGYGSGFLPQLRAVFESAQVLQIARIEMGTRALSRNPPNKCQCV